MIAWIKDAADAVYEDLKNDLNTQTVPAAYKDRIARIISRAESKARSAAQAEIPESLRREESFAPAWERWLKFRREKSGGKKLPFSTQEVQLAKLEKWGAAKSVASINQSIDAGWTGLFEPKSGIPAKARVLPPQDDYWKQQADMLIATIKRGGIEWGKYHRWALNCLSQAPSKGDAINYICDGMGKDNFDKLAL